MDFGPAESEDHRRHRDHQAGQRASRRDVEERVAIARRRAHPDDGAQRAEQEDRWRRRDEVRQADRGLVVTRREVVAELVDAEDRQQGQRERSPRRQPRRRRGPVADPVENTGQDRPGGQRGQRGEDEERQVQRRPRALPHLHERPRLQHDAVALGLQERRVAERRETRQQRVERPGRLRAEIAAEQDHTAPDLPLLDDHHLLGEMAQALLAEEQVVRMQRGEGGAAAERPQRQRPQAQRPHAHEFSLARGAPASGTTSRPGRRRPDAPRQGPLPRRARRATPPAPWPASTPSRVPRLLRPPPQPQQRPQLERARPARQRLVRHQLRAPRRQSADRCIRLRPHQILAHDQRQHRVPNKRQRQLMLTGRMLRRVRSMSECALQADRDQQTDVPSAARAQRERRFESSESAPPADQNRPDARRRGVPD